MKINKVSIIGLGALGILFGNQISKKIPFENLRIITDEDRMKRYQREGIYSNKEKCSFNYVLPEKIGEPADLLIFAVKSNGLLEAMDMVKNQVGENTIILSVLNGITSEEIIGSMYGKDKILYCVAQGMDAVKEGNQLSYNNKGLICFGEIEDGLISEKVRAVSEFFDKVQLPYEVVENMKHRLWSKFMLNVGVNQTLAVLGGNYGVIQKEGIEKETMIAAMKEVMEVAKHENIMLTEIDLEYWLKILNHLSPEGKPSMRQDVEARRYSEVELFAGTVLQYGKKHGVCTPVNQRLYDEIIEMEKSYN